MSVPMDIQKRPIPAPEKLASAWQEHPGGWQDIGAQLVSIQDASGQYRSFYWQDAEKYGLHPEEIAASTDSESFGPADPASYRSQLQKVLENGIPERRKYEFRYRENTFQFDLVFSPILMPDGSATKVLVMGNQIASTPTEMPSQQTNGTAVNNPTAHPDSASNGQKYQKILSKISRNIRRTLDPDIIWQQTVDELGQELNLSRCIVCPYKNLSEELIVIAEYRQQAVASLLGQKLNATEQYIKQALETLEPLTVEGKEIEEAEVGGMLAIATCYQNQPNGLIRLYQQNSDRQWTEPEIELVREIADQVGTAIAHATLYKELERARQEAEEASRLKSEFLANTSHELRTPLNGMLGFLKLIIEGMTDDPEEQMEFIQEAYRSAIHLLNIINDILDIAKIEAGKMELELGQVDLDELLGDVENFTKTQALHKNLSFRIQRPASRDKITLYGNYQRLLQVMLNLVGNAIKFTHEGGVLISAEIVRKKVVIQGQDLPGMVKVRVIDTGIGVSLEKQDRLFQSFSQVDGSRTRQYGGTGLGLTISQKLIEAMKGVVNFYSMGEGLGSTVTFTVPLYQDVVMGTEQPTESAEALN